MQSPEAVRSKAGATTEDRDGAFPWASSAVISSPSPAAGAQERVLPLPPADGDLGRKVRFVQDLFLRGLNVAVASIALLLLLPAMVAIAVAIKLDSRGPILYRQLRIGLDRRSGLAHTDAGGRRTADLGGRPFFMYKFRTMHLDAEESTGPVWASPEDHRTTRVGRFLRRYRLDETPQFWNVLKGDMAVVGPRPERPTFVHSLRKQVEGYTLRHRVRPGITGWAQVHQEPDQSLDDVRRKLAYDLEYLNRRSLVFDLRIMLRTLPVILDRERKSSDAQPSS